MEVINSQLDELSILMVPKTHICLIILLDFYECVIKMSGFLVMYSIHYLQIIRKAVLVRLKIRRRDYITLKPMIMSLDMRLQKFL